MKYLKNFETFNTNESWRQVKSYLQIPQILLEMLLKKIVKFVPRLSIKYDILAAKIDTDNNMGGNLTYPTILKDEPKKLELKDIENKDIKNGLLLTNFFKSWNIYYIGKNREWIAGNDEKDRIYITKDELHKGSSFFGDRLDEIGNTQIYVVVAMETKRHQMMKKERDTRYKRKRDKELEKEVNNCIKNKNYIRSKSITGEWNNDPILFKVVRANRLDLFHKIIDSVSEEKAKKLCTMKINSDGWETNYGNNNLLKNVKSDEMRDAIYSIIYTPEEIEQITIEREAEKFNM